jgi:hypothetical protein
MNRKSKLHAGEWVEVLSKEEILKTLDKRGELESLPFMPEMFRFCGKRFKVFKRAHKTCDPPNGMDGRKMLSAVHLEDIRCDGAAHGGCQAGCLIFWKEAWLRRVDQELSATPGVERVSAPHIAATTTPSGCTEDDVLANTHASKGTLGSDEPSYVCQSTQISFATQPLRWWDVRQYVEDFTSGNVRLSQMLAALLFSLYRETISAGLGISSGMRWIYDAFQGLRNGTPYPRRPGKIVKGKRTPAAQLDLQPGEVVKVKSYPEILETLDPNSRNRGMVFDAESVPFCNRTYPVLKRVKKIIDEKTGRMIRLKNDAIILQGVACQAKYAYCRRFCPRSIHHYWREIWLERASEGASPAGTRDEKPSNETTKLLGIPN